MNKKSCLCHRKAGPSGIPNFSFFFFCDIIFMSGVTGYA